MRKISRILRRRPDAAALIKGSPDYPAIKGETAFYKTESGTLVVSFITGLPDSLEGCKNKIFAFHLHEGESCTGTMQDPFADVLTHYNPNNCPHPYHAGDMPPLFSNNSEAFLAFTTGRFSVDEVIGKTVVIHSGVDDFTTQPAGNSGTKIACGKIEKWK